VTLPPPAGLFTAAAGLFTSAAGLFTAAAGLFTLTPAEAAGTIVRKRLLCWEGRWRNSVT
jgi:hypothetical protein